MSEESGPTEQDQATSWKQEPIFVFEIETIGVGEETRIVELAALQYQVCKAVSFTQSWVVNPGPVDWEKPEVIETLQALQLERELIEKAKPFSVHCGTLNNLMTSSKVWCAHCFEAKHRILLDEYIRAYRVMRAPENQLLFDLQVLDFGFHSGMESYDLVSIAKRWGTVEEWCRCGLHDAIACNGIFKSMFGELPDDTSEMRALYKGWVEMFEARQR